MRTKEEIMQEVNERFKGNMQKALLQVGGHRMLRAYDLAKNNKLTEAEALDNALSVQVYFESLTEDEYIPSNTDVYYERQEFFRELEK